MSNIASTALPFQQTPDGRWAVHLDGSTVIVQTRRDAELLAGLPVELAALSWDAPRPPDPERVRKILKVCEDYRYTSHGERHLRRWLTTREA